MESLSFDRMVEFYDGTRIFDRGCFDSALDFLVERFPPQVFSNIFEPGIGTGRIAFPLAERGYRITGVDISEEMLALLKKRLTQSRRSLEISLQKANATKLPFPNAAFDMAIAVHLFYFIQEWKKVADEILRVVRDDGPVALMHTGTGTEVPFLNERYKESCAQQGCPIKEIGVKSTREVVDYFRFLGCRAEWIRDRWQWTSRIRLDEALDYIKARAYSFTTVAPDDVHLMARVSFSLLGDEHSGDGSQVNRVGFGMDMVSFPGDIEGPACCLPGGRQAGRTDDLDVIAQPLQIPWEIFVAVSGLPGADR